MSKYFLVLLAVVLLGASDLVAQRITPAPEISIMGGWMAPGGVDACVGVQCGRIDVTAGPIFGGSIAIPARPGSNIELTYMYNGAGYIFNPTLGTPDAKVDMDVHYMQIGAQQYLPNGNVHPYGSFTVGAAVFGSQWEFAVTGGVGVKNYINEKIAIRLDARVVLPIFWGGWYVGTGGVGAGGTVGMWQGAFTGGIVYRLGQ
ncbi:hypothetical protein ACFLRO_00650 [Bacteroidota bacterium]